MHGQQNIKNYMFWPIAAIFRFSQFLSFQDGEKLHNGYLNDLYSSSNIVRVIKSRRMRWACFEHMCSSSGGQKLYYTVSGIITLIGGRPMHRLCTGRPPTDPIPFNITGKATAIPGQALKVPGSKGSQIS